MVSIDESDAFGEPHKAIHLVLKELGLNKVERRRILEVVRIRTVYKGEVLGENLIRDRTGQSTVSTDFQPGSLPHRQATR